MLFLGTIAIAFLFYISAMIWLPGIFLFYFIGSTFGHKKAIRQLRAILREQLAFADNEHDMGHILSRLSMSDAELFQCYTTSDKFRK